MSDFFLFLITFGSLSIVGYFGTKVFIYWDSRKRYKDEHAEFMSDIYRLQQKYAQRGLTVYADSFGMLIEAFKDKPAANRPVTQIGRDLLRAAKKAELDDEQ